MTATVILALWLASIGGFQDRVSCSVRGYISFETDQVALAREDQCNLRLFTLGRQMVIASETRWVIIEFPVESGEGSGFESFWYTWGAAHAYVHGKPLQITWGKTLRG